MASEDFAQATELHVAPETLAEIESGTGGLVVQHLETSIVAKNIEDRAVAFPQVLDPATEKGQ
jgi:hypothetical protein